MMLDITAALAHLRERRRLVDEAIAAVESLATNKTEAVVPRSKRGRKSMGGEERQVVSQRMKTYWANRRTGGSSRS